MSLLRDAYEKHVTCWPRPDVSPLIARTRDRMVPRVLHHIHGKAGRACTACPARRASPDKRNDQEKENPALTNSSSPEELLHQTDMPIVSTTIEIAASPAKVREVVSPLTQPLRLRPKDNEARLLRHLPGVLELQFLDFESYPEWSKSFFQSISVISQKTGEIGQGDQLKVVLPGATFKPVILVSQGRLDRFCL